MSDNLLRNSFDTYYLEVAGCDYGHYSEYYKERVGYWREFYDN